VRALPRRPRVRGAVDYGRITPLIVKAVQDIANLADAFKSKLIAWFADSANGIGQFFANVGNFHKICVTDSGGTSCYTRSELDAAVAAAAGTQLVDPRGAPAAPPASGDASTASTTTSSGPPQHSAQATATLVVNGNNPAHWSLNQIWNDNLGALFTHAGQSETIYSTTTVDATVAGTSTIDYWAVVPSSQQVLHATRAVVVSAPTNAAPIQPANDNVAPSSPALAPVGNDNTQLAPLSATGTDATTTAQ
jgi:hypothetical protein